MVRYPTHAWLLAAHFAIYLSLLFILNSSCLRFPQQGMLLFTLHTLPLRVCVVVFLEIGFAISHFSERTQTELLFNTVQ